MKVIRIVGLTFAAVLAAGLAASASATPVVGIFQCEKVPAGSGKFATAGCLKEGAPKEFEEKEIVGATFTSKSIGGTVFNVASKEIVCTAATSEGVITSRTEDRATIKFTGCKERPSEINCQNGTTAQELVVPVSSKLVSFTDATSVKAGLLLAPRTANGENTVELECVGTKIKVYGSVIGSITPESEMSPSATVKYALGAGEEQAIPERENSLRAKFGSGATEKATQQGEALLDFALDVEIMRSASVGVLQCEKVSAGSGTFATAGCLNEGAPSEFEEKEIAGATFTSKSIGGTVFAFGGNELACTAGTSEGVITSRTEDRATIKFTGCKEGAINCETSGAGTGVLLIPVSSKVVSYTSGTSVKAGLLLAPRTSGGANELTFECAGTKVKMYGSVIGAAEPEDTATSSITAKYALAGEVQAIPEATNSLRVKLGSGVTDKTTEEGTAVLGLTLQVEVMG